MKKSIEKIVNYITIRTLSTIASFALIITTVSVNQRCWYIIHEETLPDNYKKLRRF